MTIVVHPQAGAAALLRGRIGRELLLELRGRRAGLIAAKTKRMRIIAANGIAVLIPSALFLASKARAGEFDAAFYAVQGLELAAGAANIALLTLNMRDGLTMKGWFRHRQPGFGG